MLKTEDGNEHISGQASVVDALIMIKEFINSSMSRDNFLKEYRAFLAGIPEIISYENTVELNEKSVKLLLSKQSVSSVKYRDKEIGAFDKLAYLQVGVSCLKMYEACEDEISNLDNASAYLNEAYHLSIENMKMDESEYPIAICSLITVYYALVLLYKNDIENLKLIDIDFIETLSMRGAGDIKKYITLTLMISAIILHTLNIPADNNDGKSSGKLESVANNKEITVHVDPTEIGNPTIFNMMNNGIVPGVGFYNNLNLGNYNNMFRNVTISGDNENLIVKGILYETYDGTRIFLEYRQMEDLHQGTDSQINIGAERRF